MFVAFARISPGGLSADGRRRDGLLRLVDEALEPGVLRKFDLPRDYGLQLRGVPQEAGVRRVCGALRSWSAS